MNSRRLIRSSSQLEETAADYQMSTVVALSAGANAASQTRRVAQYSYGSNCDIKQSPAHVCSCPGNGHWARWTIRRFRHRGRKIVPQLHRTLVQSRRRSELTRTNPRFKEAPKDGKAVIIPGADRDQGGAAADTHQQEVSGSGEIRQGVRDPRCEARRRSVSGPVLL